MLGPSGKLTIIVRNVARSTASHQNMTQQPTNATDSTFDDPKGHNYVVTFTFRIDAHFRSGLAKVPGQNG